MAQRFVNGYSERVNVYLEKPIPSATVVVLRDTVDGPQVLLLLRNRELKFAPGAWVFPGGRIDNADHAQDSQFDIQPAARRAASREAQEEAGVSIDPDGLRLIDHFVTPEGNPRRFATWFYIADGNHCQQVSIDGGEIVDYCWLTAAQALDDHRAGDFPLIRPTRKTLETLLPATSVADAVQIGGRRMGGSVRQELS